MRKYLALAVIGLVVTTSKADALGERVKVAGFHCDYGKAVIHLRSLETDRSLYLAGNADGEPKALQMLEEHCKGLIKNLGGKLAGAILDVDLQVDRFSRKESVPVPPRNPCGEVRRKCDDDWGSVMRVFNYTRTQTMIDGYRFFSEERVEQ